MKCQSLLSENKREIFQNVVCLNFLPACLALRGTKHMIEFLQFLIRETMFVSMSSMAFGSMCVSLRCFIDGKEDRTLLFIGYARVKLVFKY